MNPHPFSSNGPRSGGNRNKYVFLVVGAIGLGVAAGFYQNVQSKALRVEGCAAWNLARDTCGETIQLSIDRKVSSGYEYAFKGYISRFSLTLNMEESAFLVDSYGGTRVTVEITDLPEAMKFDHIFAIYTGGTNLPTQRIETDALVAVSESERGPAGSDFLVHRDGRKNSWFRCAKPFLASAGNLVDDVGCRVGVYMHPSVLVEYSLRRDQLHRWNELNALMLNKVTASIFVSK